VLAEFGDTVRGADGGLDRPALAKIVFADKDALARLNAIVHPLVGARRAEIVAAAPADAVVVDDVPLLVETDAAGAFDLVLVVAAPEPVRIERLGRDRGMSTAEARSRIAAQATDEQRAAAADVVIDNDGTEADLTAEVDRVWRDLIEPRVTA
jgi:dephospho-CoA kinase